MELSLLRGVVTENGMTDNHVLETVPRQTADRARELVFNVLWSYVLLMHSINVNKLEQMVFATSRIDETSG
jgi:hypothetical protein